MVASRPKRTSSKLVPKSSHAKFPPYYTRHDVPQEYLHRFNIVKEPAICKLEDQDGEHLFRCPDLKSEIDSLPTSMDRTEIPALYWTARKRNSRIS